ncbi:MAG: hypothetical protein R2681_16620 [Pyrinomonadaceae bacterium]
MKKVLIFALILMASISLSAQTENTGIDLASFGVSITPDKRLVTVLTSLEAAGIDTPLTQQGSEFREELRSSLSSVDPNLRQKLRNFVEQYKRRHSDATSAEVLAPFITLAYSLSDAPSLTPPERSIDLPDELLEVLDFADLVSEFYKTRGVSAKIDETYKKNAMLANELRPTAREMVREVLDYLNTRPELQYVEQKKIGNPKRQGNNTIQNVETNVRERNFTIVPDLLAPKDSVNFLNIRDKYYAIVSPGIDLSSSEVRRAYLQFVLDPLVLKHAKAISAHNSSIRELLEERRKAGASVSPDVFLAVSRSLVAAADIQEEEFRRTQFATAQARRKIDLLKDDNEKRAVVEELNRVKAIFADESVLQLSESYENGAVLAFYFAGKLKGSEDAGFDIANSLENWIVEINAKAETNRIAENKITRDRAMAERDKRRTSTIVETTLVSNPLTEDLLSIDKDIDARKLTEAEQALTALLEKYPSGATRIYYSLGRVASISAEDTKDGTEVNRRLIKAKDYFEKALSAATPVTDRELVTLTYVSLGRIYEFYDQKEYAVKIYETAMKIGNADGEGFKQAFAAKQKLVND